MKLHTCAEHVYNAWRGSMNGKLSFKAKDKDGKDILDKDGKATVEQKDIPEWKDVTDVEKRAWESVCNKAFELRNDIDVH